MNPINPPENVMNASTPVHLQVVQHLCPGGIETMALDLLRHAGRDESVFIVSLEGDHADAVEAWPVLRAVQDRLLFMNKRPGWQPGLIARLRRWMLAHNVASVHTHHIGPLIYAGLAARLAGIEYRIHTEHDAWHLSERKRRLLQQAILGLVRPTLVADALAVATSLRQHWPNLPIHTIHNGIDTERFTPGDCLSARARLALPAEVRLIGCSGRLEAVKGQDRLIDAMACLGHDIHLAIAGAGSCEQALRWQVRALGLESRVHFLGRVDDMPNFYRAIDLFCLPSLHEGMPLSPLEAQACGVPALVTDVGGSSEAICPASGHLVSDASPLALAAAIRRALERGVLVDPRQFVLKQRNVRLMTALYERLRKPATIGV
jgi:glycosyltransferase involved in cell wall biosynthesis